MNFILADEQSETDLVKQLRSGVHKILLPESSDDLYAMINTLTAKKVNLPRFVLKRFLLIETTFIKRTYKR